MKESNFIKMIYERVSFSQLGNNTLHFYNWL